MEHIRTMLTWKIQMCSANLIRNNGVHYGAACINLLQKKKKGSYCSQLYNNVQYVDLLPKFCILLVLVHFRQDMSSEVLKRDIRGGVFSFAE